MTKRDILGWVLEKKGDIRARLAETRWSVARPSWECVSAGSLV